MPLLLELSSLRVQKPAPVRVAFRGQALVEVELTLNLLMMQLILTLALTELATFDLLTLR